MIVLAVIAVSLVFLWPTVSWYWLTPKADQALALGSREQIREYARSHGYHGSDRRSRLSAASATTRPSSTSQKYSRRDPGARFQGLRARQEGQARGLDG